MSVKVWLCVRGEGGRGLASFLLEDAQKWANIMLRNDEEGDPVLPLRGHYPLRVT
jgi:hypothetical protein